MDGMSGETNNSMISNVQYAAGGVTLGSSWIGQLLEHNSQLISIGISILTFIVFLISTVITIRSNRKRAKEKIIENLMLEARVSGYSDNELDKLSRLTKYL